MRKLCVLAASLGLLVGCIDDPQDPRTWIKKLDNPREQREAVRQLARLKDEVAYEPLAKLFRQRRDQDVLDAIAKLRSDKAVPLFIEQLDYSDETFEAAATAATGLAEIASRDAKGREAARAALEALHKAVLKKLPIRTRANIVKVEAMKAIAAIRDPSSVETLNAVLETSADEQDFFLNKLAAQHLGTFADKRSIPVLIRGLFMTGRGKDIFQDCRLALVRIGGDEAVDKLVESMQRKNARLEEDAKKYEFVPGIIVQKTSILLGDLRNKRAIPALLAELKKKDEGLVPGGVSGHQSVLQALGLLGDPSVVKDLIAVASDPKRHSKLRAAAATGLNFLGATEALPVLLQLAKTPYFNPKNNEIDTDKALLAAVAVTEYSRLADTDVTDILRPLYDAAPPDTDIQVAFKNALARVAVVKKCGKDIACYGERLAQTDPDKTIVSAISEKAAFMLGRLGRQALPVLQKHVAHKDSATRFAVLFSLTRLANKNDQGVLQALYDQIEIDKTKPPLMPLVDEMRVTAAIISHS
ncbi:MAG: HEAT repeat domain-containing protein [Myxococcales bacterium]|nr:HEAT repeat domain-containing protein [Myxococcota bacterium]MDW8281680.1 HEAT repeat domain-containing protein [Myxococcales bacterium]